jgi:hypothetical protein
MGAFAVSAILHHIGLRGSGNGTEFVTSGGFFLLMSVGAVIEGFKRVGGLVMDDDVDDVVAYVPDRWVGLRI